VPQCRRLWFALPSTPYRAPPLWWPSASRLSSTSEDLRGPAFAGAHANRALAWAPLCKAVLISNSLLHVWDPGSWDGKGTPRIGDRDELVSRCKLVEAYLCS
jgi:hypothetical protein